ncbi:hypothetical protein Leryth_003284 [Lithospermum erythrorhizon]|nr:hypothetical protein Leryth_003284 [Lithospermum erythrorhizon]
MVTQYCSYIRTLPNHPSKICCPPLPLSIFHKISTNFSLNHSFVIISSWSTLQMAAKPLSHEALALTEKKMDMALDDIINLSKTNENKWKKQRVWNRDQKFSNNASQDKHGKVQRFTNSRSSMRQGAISQKRTNFQSNQFPLATEAAKKAYAAPLHNRNFNQRTVVNINKLRVAPPPYQKKAANGGGFMTKQNSQHQVKPAMARQKPQTLDALFANMKEERLKSLSHNNSGPRRNAGGYQSIVPWARGRFIS